MPPDTRDIAAEAVEASAIKPRKRSPLAGPSRSQVLANARRATSGIKVGKPLSYHPSLCQHALALGQRGKSWAHIARAFGVSRKTINEWEGLYPEFGDALARARAAAQAWWEDHGQRNLKADRYQTRIWERSMMARFPDDYMERRESTVTFDLGRAIEALHGPDTARDVTPSVPRVSPPTDVADEGDG
jgi:hypothetical protein